MSAIAVGSARPYIGGEWAEPSDGRLVEVINPTTEEPIGHAHLAGPADVDRASAPRERRSTPVRGPRQRPWSAQRSCRGPDS